MSKDEKNDTFEVKLVKVKEYSELIPLIINGAISDRIFTDEQGQLHLSAARYFHATQNAVTAEYMERTRQEVINALTADIKKWFFEKKINKTIQQLLPERSSLITLPLTPVNMIALGVACECKSSKKISKPAEDVVKLLHAGQAKFDNVKLFVESLGQESLIKLMDLISAKPMPTPKPVAKDIRFLGQPTLSTPLLLKKNCSLNS